VHPQLHKATEPRCLHAYALSNRGAKHLVRLFSDPWKAYQTPVDTFIPYLTRQSTAAAEKKLKERKKGKPNRLTNTPLRVEDVEDPDAILAFSLEPPLIIQAKEMASDIQTGTGSVWRGLLADSTWDRIQRDEGREVRQLTWDDIKADPAIRARPWGDWGVSSKQPNSAKDASSKASLPIVHVQGSDSPFEQQQDGPILVVPVSGGGGEGDRAADKHPDSLPLAHPPADDKAADRISKPDLPAAVKEAQALAREKAMARPVDSQERERERLLEALPKKPGALLGKKPKEDGRDGALNGGNRNILGSKNREALNAVAEAMKKGEKAPKKGGDAAANRVGTGPKRIGRPVDKKIRRDTT